MASLEAGSISDGSPANAWTPHRRAPSHVEHATPRHHEGAPSHERPHKTPALPAPAPRHKHHLHAEIVKLGHRGEKREPGPNQIVGPHDFSAHLAGGLAALPTATKSGHAGREALGHRDKSFRPHGPMTRDEAAKWEAEAEAKRRDFAKNWNTPHSEFAPTKEHKHIPHAGREALGHRQLPTPHASRVALGHRDQAMRAPTKPNEYFTRENADALRETAGRLGASPHDLAMAIGYETVGSYSPRKWGGKGGHYMGLIQFGPRERAKYGAHEGQSFKEQLGPVERYLKDRGFKPGMGIHDLYSTILTGRPGQHKARDMHGSVDQHVGRMFRERGEEADRFLASPAAEPAKTADK